MASEFKLPDLGEGLTEAEIVKVLVAEGDQVKEDQPVLLVETEKAQVELPSPFEGRVAKVHVRPGQRVKVGSVLVSFGDTSVAGPATSVAEPRVGGGGGAARPPRPEQSPLACRRRRRRRPAGSRGSWGSTSPA